MNESEYTRKKIMPRIRDRGGVAVKKAAGPHSPRGMPDVLGCYRGRAIALEVKLPGRENTLTEIQRDTLDTWRAAGAEAAMVSDPGRVDDILDGIDAEADGG